MKLGAVIVCCMLALADPCKDNIDSCDTCENPAMQCTACTGNRIISNDSYYCVECPENSDLDHCTDVGKDIMGK
ncbi:hypothetical protein LSH36_391g02026, partial [Paralvinella palmiformis]